MTTGVKENINLGSKLELCPKISSNIRIKTNNFYIRILHMPENYRTIAAGGYPPVAPALYAYVYSVILPNSSMCWLSQCICNCKIVYVHSFITLCPSRHFYQS